MRSISELKLEGFQARVLAESRKLSVADIVGQSGIAKEIVEILKIEEELTVLCQPISLTGSAEEVARQSRELISKRERLEGNRSALLSDILLEAGEIFGKALAHDLTTPKS